MINSQPNHSNQNLKLQPLVWVVDSAYTGELHARIGLAKRLGYGYDIIPIPPINDTSDYAQELFARYQVASDGQKLILFIISGTGEETTAPIADLKKIFAECLFNIYLASILPSERHPRLCEYDLIASPQLSGENIVSMVGVPHQMTHESLAMAYHEHQQYFNSLPKPIIGLLVGGNTRYCDGFNEHHAEQLAKRVAKINSLLSGCIVITNSRRTPHAAIKALLNELKTVNHHFFDWQQIDNSFYQALLAHADLFIVTGDSLSMCSEAAFTGKPLLVDMSDTATEYYHREIVGKLIAYGAAKLLTDSYEPWYYQPPDPTGMVVKAIHTRFQNIL